MLKRYRPSSQPDGTKTLFVLPITYIGGNITLFINGQLVDTQNDTEHPFGYILDEGAKTYEFYTPPLDEDFIYLIYDDTGISDVGTDFSGSGLMRLRKGYNLISYQGQHQAKWNKDTSMVEYDENVLANVQNLLIDQIEEVYGVQASTIIREIQTYSDDVQQYFTFKPGATGVSWCGNAEHVYNKDLYRAASANEYGDPEDGDYVAYTPGNFILSNCKLDDANELISLDVDNDIAALPAGLRTGIHVFIFEDADLSATDDRLELWF